MKLNKMSLMGTTLFLAAAMLAACSNNKSSRRSTTTPAQQPVRPNIPPGGLQNQTGPNNKSNPHQSRADDIQFNGKDTMYNPSDKTHVVNPNVKPVLTGYSSNEYSDYTDAGDDNIMELLRNRLDNMKKTDLDAIKKSREKTGDTEEAQKADDKTLRQENLKLAQSISRVSLHRRGTDYQVTLMITVDGDELKYTADLNDTENGSKKKRFKMETEDSSDYDAELSCVAISSRDACSVSVVHLTKKEEAFVQAFVVFRKQASHVYLGEYTSKLVYEPQGDFAIDRWHQFFRDLDFHQAYASSEGSTPIAELRTFAVVNGISGFDVRINRDEYAPLALSGQLETHKRGPSTKVNLPLKKEPMDDNHDNTHEDIIENTIKSATLVHNNGRGMLQVGIQLVGFREGPDTENGGIHRDEKTQRKLQQQDRRLRHNQQRRGSNGSNSSRLEQPENRALRLTFVPILPVGIDESLVRK